MGAKGTSRKPLWHCPRCGAGFTNANQWHSCGTFDLERHFVRADPVVRELFDRFVELARRCGPVTVLPQKTRIALQVRMRFAALMPQRRILRGHLVLARRVESPRFEEVVSVSPRNHVHLFRLARPAELDRGFGVLIREAYAVGRQEHLSR